MVQMLLCSRPRWSVMDALEAVGRKQKGWKRLEGHADLKERKKKARTEEAVEVGRPEGRSERAAFLAIPASAEVSRPCGAAVRNTCVECSHRGSGRLWQRTGRSLEARLWQALLASVLLV